MAKRGGPQELGTERLGKLLVQYSVPAIVATAAASIYNIIDRIFIGQGVGPLAISGLALTFPLMNITAAFGSLVGVGAGTMVSIRLGQHDRKVATMILGNTVILNVILSLIVAITFLVFLNPLLYAVGGSKDTLPYARDFMQIILAGNIFTHLYLGLNNIMRSSGYPTKAMITTLITVAVNLVLAPLFIFVFKWGIRGAALATVCAQVCGTIWVMTHFTRVRSFLHFLPGYFKVKKAIVKDIFSIGLSNFLMLITASVVVLIFNLSLKKYGGDFAIGAFGIIGSIGNLVVMIVFGLNQGMQPIAGYNYGARKMSRVLRTYNLTVLAATIVTTAGFVIVQLFPGFIASAFTTDQTLSGLAREGMRLYFVVFPIVGFQVVTSSFFQSIGKAQISILLSLSRQVLFLIPAILIVPHFLLLRGVWLSAPVADFMATIVTFFVLRWQMKRLKLLAK
jgi:putative MATE family efflux protein